MRHKETAALVTGATGGIGGAVAQRLASEGAAVAVHTHTKKDRAQALADELEGDGHGVVQADLVDREARRRLVEEVVEGLGGLDVLVNNAGRYVEHPPAETDADAWEEVWDRTLELNLRAPADLVHAAVDALAEGGGAVVNVSSRGAYRGEPDAPAYGASKAGLNALTGSMAKALAPRGIRVAAVAPGFVDTPMVAEILESERGDEIRGQSPLERVAEPEEVAAAVAYLAADEAEFATGTVVDVNGASYLRG
jgi:NAD(P)-dependent dehydrogenase (short-subunit alcohol dehydrogenase family)